MSNLFPRMYGTFVSIADKSSLGLTRHKVISQATGTVLELGAGTGSNLPWYRSDVSLLLAEPDPEMRMRLQRALNQAGKIRRSRSQILACRAEALPLANHSVDTVVSTLTLCSVEDLEKALQEVLRVLQPNGSMIVFEHVRGEGSHARRQERISNAWARYGGGCRPNRDIASAIEAVGFSFEKKVTISPKRKPPIVWPYLIGSARPATAKAGVQ
jgi:ubiquinone/menaquinone biosynthesis C-methylase UbiE